MTKREREKIEKAIELIHADEGAGNDYSAGMEILCDLIGRKYPDLKNVEKMTIQELAQRKNSRG